MAFTDLFIKRPVLSLVVSLLILLIGFKAATSLGIRQYPKLSNTVVTVTTSYPGASPDLMQGFITQPIEQAVASAEGVEEPESGQPGAASPVMASMAPSLASAATADRQITLDFRGPSWIDIVAQDGGLIERGMVAAGSQRKFAVGRLTRITLGDAAAVDVSIAGTALDLGPYRDANIARFAVSSEGKIVPASGNESPPRSP